MISHFTSRTFSQTLSHSDSFLAVISALYAKFLIVMGLAFPMTEVISNHVTSSSYLVTKNLKLILQTIILRSFVFVSVPLGFLLVSLLWLHRLFPLRFHDDAPQQSR